MMDTLNGMLLGFGTALAPGNLMYAFLGVVLGNVVGVLPGIGPLAAISMLLPITFSIEPAAALMMLAGIYYGAQYGGATTSIMLNLPGVASHAVTCLDGHPMAKKGRAGAALLLAMLASFFGATIGILIMMFFSPIISETALKFGPAEYFSMMVLGLLAATTLSQGSAVKGVVMVVLGIVLGVVGTDVNTGTARFTFGIPHLYDGISLVALAMGLFGIADVLRSVNRIGKANVQGKGVGWRNLKLTKEETRRSIKPMARGTGIGAFFGVLPGTGSTIASFMSYALEKKVSKTPQAFGKGAVEGVVGPEAS
ncbi:MAG TPA: tripartite tricarboxylate transporter permease, partial [Noviherbaspirillum sp.]|nr:tripartite tricarboxylate transporter permease [Noviherbaspirillum sp.]